MTRFKKWFPWLRQPDNTEKISAAQEELDRAQQGVRAAKREQHHAHHIARTLQDIREKNHFGEAIERAYKDNKTA